MSESSENSDSSEDWRGDLHPKDKYEGDSTWWLEKAHTKLQYYPESLIDQSIGTEVRFVLHFECNAIPVDDPRSATKFLITFHRGRIHLILEPDQIFCPSINKDACLNIDETIEWNQAGKPAFIYSGETGVAILIAKACSPGILANNEYFICLDLEDTTTEIEIV